MKKILLGTTALVAATAISAGVAKAEISLSGSMHQRYGISTSSDKQTHQNDGLVSYQNANIGFSASADLDNGMSMSWGTTMYVPTAGTGSIGETKFTLSDDWGKLVLGSDDGAADAMHGGGAAVTWTGLSGGSGFSSFASNYSQNKAYMSSKDGLGISDSPVIGYFSPDMNGLSFGIEYMPTLTSGASTSADDGSANVYSLGVAYSADMGDASVGITAGVEHMANPEVSGAGGDDDRTHFRASVDVSAGGLGLNVGYATTDYKTATSTEVDEWIIEGLISYTVAEHTFGIEAQYSEQANGTTGSLAKREATNFAVEYSMDIGNGVWWDVAYVMLDDDLAGSTASDVDVNFVFTSVGVSF